MKTPLERMKKRAERIKRTYENVRDMGIGGIYVSVAEDIVDICDEVTEGAERLNDKVDKTFDDIEDFIENPSVKKLLPRVKNDISTVKATSTRKLKAGDIIAVSRNLPYQHFAVYIGRNRVIHFAAENGDLKGTPTIHEAPFKNFLRDSKEFEILEFSDKHEEPRHYIGVNPDLNKCVAVITRMPLPLLDVKNEKYHLYSAEETVQRAKDVAEQCLHEGSKFETFINGHKYSLVFNNCEHFAIWCKTGIHESRQVNKVLRFFGGVTAMMEESGLIVY